MLFNLAKRSTCDYIWRRRCIFADVHGKQWLKESIYPVCVTWQFPWQLSSWDVSDSFTATPSRYRHTSAKLTNAAPWLIVCFFLLLPGLHVFLERLYFFRASRVHAGGAGAEGEATAGGLRGEEERPALKEGENRMLMFSGVLRKTTSRILCSVCLDRTVQYSARYLTPCNFHPVTEGCISTGGTSSRQAGFVCVAAFSGKAKQSSLHKT